MVLRMEEYQITMPGPAPSCTCGHCRRCIAREYQKRRGRTVLPTTFEQAVEARKHSAGLLMWPHISQSIRTLEDSFPHLKGASL